MPDITVEHSSHGIVSTAAELAASNPVLLVGRYAYASDTHVLRIGDGVTPLNDLPVFEERILPVRSETTTQMLNITALTDVTDLAPITFTVGVIPWVVHLHLDYITPTAVGTAIPIAEGIIADAVDTIMRTGFRSFPVAVGHSGQLDVYERISVPGTYTRKAKFARIGASSVFQLNANDPKIVSFLKAGPER